MKKKSRKIIKEYLARQKEIHDEIALIRAVEYPRILKFIINQNGFLRNLYARRRNNEN